MNIVAGLKAAAKSLAAGPKAQSFRVAGKVAKCFHCENVLFRKSKASLNTASSSMTNTEWTDHEASSWYVRTVLALNGFTMTSNLHQMPNQSAKPSQASGLRG